MNISLSAFDLRSCLRIWSRETGSAVPSRVSLLISILRLNLVLTYGISPEFRGGVHLFIYSRHTPSGVIGPQIFVRRPSYCGKYEKMPSQSLMEWNGIGGNSGELAGRFVKNDPLSSAGTFNMPTSYQ